MYLLLMNPYWTIWYVYNDVASDAIRSLIVAYGLVGGIVVIAMEQCAKDNQLNINIKM